MRVLYGSASDIGKARDRNEDSYLAEPPVFAVADGMGGHKGGDVASSLAIQVLGGDALPSDGAELVERVREANRAVYERSSSDTAVEGMGTTMTTRSRRTAPRRPGWRNQRRRPDAGGFHDGRSSPVSSSCC